MTRLELHGKAMRWDAKAQKWVPHKLIKHIKTNKKSDEQPSDNTIKSEPGATTTE
jgi:hypothetical protein